MLNSECSKCNHRSESFKYLTEEEFEIVEQNKNEVRFKSGEIIYKQGASMTHVVTLGDGLVKIYLEGPQNKNLILKIQKSGELISSPGMFFDKKHHFSVAAITDCSVCLIEVDTIKHLIRKNNAFAEGFHLEISKRSISIFEKFIFLTQKQMHGRIAEALLYLSENVFNSSAFDMLISRQELAEMTSLSKESAIRILKEFKDDGIISLKGNNIEILNEKLLRNISTNG